MILEKETYSAVNDKLMEYLLKSDINEVYLCGFDTDGCILKTAFDLFENNINKNRPPTINCVDTINTLDTIFFIKSPLILFLRQLTFYHNSEVLSNKRNTFPVVTSLASL